MVYGGEDQWGEDKLKRTLGDMDELCKKYPWLCELYRGYVVLAQNDHALSLVVLNNRKR